MSTTLNPPAPPKRRCATEIPIGLSGWSIRVEPDRGGMIVHRTADKSQTTMIGVTEAERETLAYQLQSERGGTR